MKGILGRRVGASRVGVNLCCPAAYQLREVPTHAKLREAFYEGVVYSAL